ncbi:hypothetical protein ACA910_022497 [Epithemia clementina (nom. ined.)]
MSTTTATATATDSTRTPCPACGSPTCRCEDCKCTDELCCSLASTVIQSLASERSSPGGRKRNSSESLLGNSSGQLRSDPLATPQQQQEQRPQQSNVVEAEFTINGMSCVNCSNSIERSVLQLNGVQSISVNLGTDSAKVKWEENNDGGEITTSSHIKDAIEAVGYSVEHINVLSKESTNKGQSNKNSTVEAEIHVAGMTCSMCSQAIETAVGKLAGVHEVLVVLATDTAHVSWDKNQTTLKDIKEAIENVGYVVERVEFPYKRRGQANNTATTEEGNRGEEEEEEEPMDERWQRISRRQTEKVQKKRLVFLWSLVGTLPILLITMGLEHVWKHGFLYHNIVLAGHPIELKAFILWILATPVQFITGFEFYKMTYYNLRSGRAGMDVLVALGTTAAYGYALVGAFSGDAMSANFFETSAVLICFVLAGKWLQASAVRRTSEALTRLMQLQSKTAVKVTPKNSSSSSSSFTTTSIQSFNPLTDPYTEASVPIQQVQKGDIIKVIRGASIPADGRVIFGAMSVDESMVTGESMPVLKTNGSDVLGGTICVESSSDDQERDSVGAAFVEVTGVGSATALAQIIQLVQDAQTRSVPIQTFADSVASIFVPAVCLISLLTYMTWYALCKTDVVPPSWYEDLGEDPVTFSLMFGIACLVISCPCALGLATPTAVMVGTGEGAKVGVLMKGGEALEVASKVDSVIFDKTGTLTKGKPAITDYVRVDKTDEFSDEYLLWLLGCLERTSEHPLAKAVVSYVEEKLTATGYLDKKPFVEPTEFRALTGRGASGVISGGVRIAAGNRSFASKSNFAVPRKAEEAMREIEHAGKTAILVAADETVAVVLGLSDELKSGAKASIKYLREAMNVDVWMVTGDNERTARAIALQLGLPQTRVIAEALPAAKLEQVRRLQDEGHLVAMVGDGINDSPALAQADVGISVGTAAEIATEASDLVLVKGDVEDVCTALHLSRAIFRRIQLNLLWSLLYNVLGIPLAAGVFYPFVQRRLPPTVAALAMALSSVSVVMSSLSLRLYKPPKVNTRQRPSRRRRRNQIISSRSSNHNTNTTGSNDLRQDLLSNDFLSASEVTESTARVDNRSSRAVVEVNSDIL